MISSTAGLRRWISSMKSTSRSSRLVSCAARSPALAITGPEVERKLTPSSRATIWASVVLPRPGGPTKSTWSSASLRAFDEPMKTWRFARACFWPMNSASPCGRSDASASSSRRSGVRRRLGVAFMSPRQLPQPQPDQRLRLRRLAGLAKRRGDGGGGLSLRIAEIDEGRDRIRHGLRRAPVVDGVGEADQRRGEGAERGGLVLALRDDAGGELWADAGRAGNARLVAGRDRGRERARVERREDRQRDLGADPLHRLQQAEPFPLLVGAEAEEADHVLADMGLDRQRRRLADRGQGLERARRAMHEVADAGHVEDDEVLAVSVDHAAQLADHPHPCSRSRDSVK